jgi:hypothetical protein
LLRQVISPVKNEASEVQLQRTRNSTDIALLLL